MTGILAGLIQVVQFFASIVQILVIASVVASWIGDRNNQIVRTIFAITEPMYAPIRRFTNRIPGPLDWAPLVLLAIVMFLQYAIVGVLQDLMMRS